jgi:hypothetical protein
LTVIFDEGDPDADSMEALCIALWDNKIQTWTIPGRRLYDVPFVVDDVGD